MLQRQPSSDTPPPSLRILRIASKPRAGVPIVRVQLAMIFAALMVRPIAKVVDTDFWWHLRAGELIVTSGIPTRDPFSWSAGGRPWVAHEWLSEVIIYAVQTTLGYAANMALFGAATVAAMLLMYRLGRSYGVGTRPLVALTLLSAGVFELFITVRPQVFTWLLFAVFVVVLEGDDARKGRRIWLLPPLMALWVNLHLGFMYGLMVVGIWLAARVYERLRRRDVDLGRPLRVTLACVIATLANPSGAAILWYPSRYLFDGSVTRRFVQEWQRPDISNLFHAPIFIAAFLLAISVLSRTRPRPFMLLLAVASVALSMDALRNAPFAALVLIPVVGGAAARRWPAARREADSSIRAPLPVALALPLLTAAIVGPLALTYGGAVSLWSPNESGYPSAAVAYVRDNEAGRRLFNGYSVGGYEIYKLYPQTRVFVDGRSDFYGDRFLEDYMTMLNARPGWETIFARYDPEVVLLPATTPLVGALRDTPGWYEAFTSPSAVVLVRR